MHLVRIITDVICNTLLDPKILERSRIRKGAFTRNCKKLPYWTFMELMFKNVKKTISASLDEFFTSARLRLGGSISSTITCSQQAFSKARTGISHAIFQECFERVLDVLCSPDSHEFHHRFMGVWGVQFIAIDGSKIPLPNRKELLEKYGSIGRGNSSPTAIASVAYDVLNARIIDAQIDLMSVDERTLAIRHLDNIANKSRANLLYTMFVFDRGYASKNLISHIEDTLHTRYLFRLRSKFNVEIDQLPAPAGDEICDYTIDYYGRKARVLKFRLSSGIIETLLTNDFSLDKTQFQYAYFTRWPVEENYKLLKEKVGLIDFRGRSENSILQEFWLSVLLANVALLIKTETDGIINATKNKEKTNKYKFQTNMNELVGHLSRHIDEYMEIYIAGGSVREKYEIIRNIFQFGIAHTVIDKKGREESNPRNEPRKTKFHYNVKRTH